MFEQQHGPIAIIPFFSLLFVLLKSIHVQAI